SNSVATQHTVVVLRAGGWYDRSYYIAKCNEVPDGRGGVGYGGECKVRYEDTGANMLNGTANTTLRRIDRPQINGSLTYIKDGWGGSHSFKVGGEFMQEMQKQSNITF